MENVMAEIKHLQTDTKKISLVSFRGLKQQNIYYQYILHLAYFMFNGDHPSWILANKIKTNDQFTNIPVTTTEPITGWGGAPATSGGVHESWDLAHD